MFSSNGYLELIIGCMFSGKSSELLKQIKKFKLLSKKLLVINHIFDNRFGKESHIKSHNNEIEKALSLSRLGDIQNSEIYNEAEVIFIDEGQFFEDLYAFVYKAIEKDNKYVVISGLDGDYKRQPFMNVLSLIPLADRVQRLNALCSDCGDGTPGCFSKRTTSNMNQRTLVGGSDMYKSVCRKHWNHAIHT